MCWNVFGSVLYSCGDDGRIRMWKGWIVVFIFQTRQNFILLNILGTINGPWKCESNISLQAEAFEKAKNDANQPTESVIIIIKN